jgi:ABC-type uncharacterized transport system ATPase subunit
MRSVRHQRHGQPSRALGFDRPPATDSYAVELHGITKRFPGVVANKDIELSVRRGTVHALVGENGAGKSTLMKILYGVQQPDEGTITVNGQVVTLKSPTEAIKVGIGMVFQHFMLADNLTVLENVVLGAEKLHGIGDACPHRESERSPRNTAWMSTRTTWSKISASVPGSASRSSRCSTAGPRSSSSTSPRRSWSRRRSTELFDNLRELKAEGLTVMFISHKLDEVLSVADDITVIRRGTTVATVDPKTVNARQLAELMVGSALPSPRPRSPPSPTGRSSPSRASTCPARRDNARCWTTSSLTIHAGEIVGIAGVEGNGQAELVEVIMGMREPTSGQVPPGEHRHLRLGGPRDPRGRRRLHPRGPPPARPAARGPALGEPSSSATRPKPPTSRANSSTPRRPRPTPRRIVKDYDVRTPSINVTSGSLSGGNQQKLIVGREMTTPRGCSSPPTPPVGSTSAHSPRSGTSSRRLAARAWRSCSSRPTLRSWSACPTPSGSFSAAASRVPFDPDVVTREELGAAMTGADGHATRRTVHERSPREDPRSPKARPARRCSSILVAMVITSVILLAAKDPVGEVWAQLLRLPSPRQIIAIVNEATCSICQRSRSRSGSG